MSKPTPRARRQERAPTLRARLTAAEQQLAALLPELEESRQTLDAIRSGSVDALVVSGPDGERIFTLQGADHRYRQIVEGMTEGALILSRQGIVLYANAAFAKLVGAPLDRVLGSSLERYLAGANFLELERRLSENPSHAVSMRATLQGPSGEKVPVHLSGTADKSDAQQVVSLVVTDLTSTMQETQRQHADEFRQLVDNVPDLAWHAQPDGHIDFFNKRWYEYTNTSFDQVAGWGWKSLLHPDLLRSVVDRWTACISGGEAFEMEFPLRGADGVYRWFLTRIRPLRNEDGKIVRWFGTNTDIDSRRREAAARAFMQQAGAVLASSLNFEETLRKLTALPVPEFADLCSVYLRRADGSVAQVAVTHNAPEQMDLLRRLHDAREATPGASFAYRRVLESGSTELVEHAAGQEVLQNDEQRELLQQLAPKSWIGVPLRVRQSTVGALFFAYLAEGRSYSRADVPLVEELGKRAAAALENARLYEDAQAAAEAEREARNKADEATRLKDEFLTTLSHELRTPLNAILGWSRMLQSKAATEEQRTRGVDTIVRNAIAQNQLIEDLLDVSRIVSGKMRLSVDVVDFADVITAAIDVVQPAADAKGVRLQAVLDPDAGLISGDAARLQQIVWNLLTNAVKFTPRGGHVQVSLRRDDSAVDLSVTDTGAGIAPEFLPYVFDRFRQQDAGITRMSGGLGLGLAIVKNLTELHGGRVEVSSAGPGQGARFVIRIPVTPVRSTIVSLLPQKDGPPTVREPAALSCPSEIASLKILVVDDEPDARELLKVVFERCGGEVTKVGSVAEALDVVGRLRPDVIVSDIGMPEEDGYSFIRKLRARAAHEGGSTPAIALTAYARSEDRHRALGEGFNSHATKPVDPQELLTVVANLAARYRRASG
ncbi:MAG TPA: ATP-binding protein [Polyangiaceae bacterium]|nr:ATP-binding protein [Polyangiaceae bacterium]